MLFLQKYNCQIVLILSFLAQITELMKIELSQETILKFFVKIFYNKNENINTFELLTNVK